MTSENSKTSDPYRLILNLSGKISSKRSDKYIVLPNLSIYYTLKNVLKNHVKTIHLLNQPQHGMTNFNYLMVHNVYQIFQIILST